MSHSWMSRVTHMWTGHFARIKQVRSHKYEWVMSHMNASCHTWMSHVTYEWVMSQIKESCHMCMHLWRVNEPLCDMGWLRLVVSIKLQVAFAENRLFYRALLQKRPIIQSILLTEANPYVTRNNSENLITTGGLQVLPLRAHWGTGIYVS